MSIQWLRLEENARRECRAKDVLEEYAVINIAIDDNDMFCIQLCM